MSNGNDIIKKPGGFILLARKILDSEIWINKPAWWLKVWIYILLNVNYEDTSFLKRGQGFFNAKKIQTACNLHSEGIKTKTIYNVIAGLKEATQIGTQKTTHGMIVTICNYDEYQYIFSYISETKAKRKRNESETKAKPFYQKKERINNKYSFVENSIEFQLGKFLLKKIILRKTDFKKPNLQSWARHIDYMVRLDGRHPDEIREVIVWCQRDSFWQNNILSPIKLRQQYDQLVLKMSKKKTNAAQAQGKSKELEFKKAKFQKKYTEYMKNISKHELSKIKEQVKQRYVLTMVPDFFEFYSIEEQQKKLKLYYDSYIPKIVFEKLGITEANWDKL